MSDYEFTLPLKHDIHHQDALNFESRARCCEKLAVQNLKAAQNCNRPKTQKWFVMDAQRLQKKAAHYWHLSNKLKVKTFRLRLFGIYA